MILVKDQKTRTERNARNLILNLNRNLDLNLILNLHLHLCPPYEFGFECQDSARVERGRLFDLADLVAGLGLGVGLGLGSLGLGWARGFLLGLTICVVVGDRDRTRDLDLERARPCACSVGGLNLFRVNPSRNNTRETKQNSKP